jgi:hypothetical protein
MFHSFQAGQKIANRRAAHVLNVRPLFPLAARVQLEFDNAAHQRFYVVTDQALHEISRPPLVPLAKPMLEKDLGVSTWLL